MAAERRPAWAAPTSVRARTTLAASAVVAAALLAGALATVTVLRRSLVANVDSTLRTRAADVASLLGEGALPPTLAVPGEEDALVQVVDPSGRVVASSANLEGQEPIATFQPIGTEARIHTVGGLPVGNSGGFRVAAFKATAPAGPVVVYVAASLEQADRSVTTVRDILLLGLPLLLALVGVTSWVIVGRALKPVESMRARLADISAHDLSQRLPQPGTDDEIGRLATTMNAMLDRLETFTERQRRFAADASHELQSPLASSRSVLEVAAAHADTTDWAQTAADLMDDNARMERLVRDLLFVARAGDPAATAHRPVDLDEVVREEVQRARARSRVPIDASQVAAVEVKGNADQLARVIRNLVENADRHASSVVSVELRRRDGQAEVVVADDGPGIAPQDRERIFERFTRVDVSRSRDTGGTGLGLAIAREIVHAHGGDIFVAEADVGARLVVRIPCT